MLRRLLIENFILIEELCLNFGEGATAFTGETGAGKSMILDALAAAIGGRVSPEMIRAGAKRASIEAEFFVDPVVESLLAPLLEEASIDREDRRFLTLMREVNERGGKCRIDGQPLSLQAFKQIGALFIDILGQHEHQHLTKPSNHLALLDGFAGLFPLREEFKARYEDFKKLEVRIEEIRVRRSRLERERELDLFQLAELEEAALQPFEEESLKTERSLLAHAEELAKRTLSGHSLLMGGENPGAVDLLARAAKEIDSVLCYDPTLESLALQLSEISENANLIARELRERSEGNEPDPVRLDGIEARLDLLHTLKRKYGGEISFLLSKRDELKARLEEGVQSDQRLSHLEKERQEKFGLLQELAEKLSIQRKSFSFALQERIEGELGELGMRGTQFVVQLSPKSIGPLGGDEIEFLIAPNPGEPPRALSKIASGGELARLMLAFKTVLAGNDPTPTLVFDEVDAGISGQAALVVASKISSLSRRSQIILVTHLPAIAAATRAHYLLSKEVEEGRTSVRARLLDEKGRVEAIARLIGGEPTPVSLSHAEELLQRASRFLEVPEKFPEGIHEK